MLFSHSEVLTDRESVAKSRFLPCEWEWAEMPVMLSWPRSCCWPSGCVGVWATPVAGGPRFLADKRSRDQNKWGGGGVCFFLLTTEGRWRQSGRRGRGLV